MPGSPPQDADASSRRADDHAAIDHLADELLPALIAKLAATGLGELEVREGDWKVRLRRPAAATAKRTTERAGRGSSHRPTRRSPRSHRSVPAVTAATGTRRADPRRSVATSPAVGIFQPRTGVRAGTRVRAGDRLGIVDMLGVAQEVVTPVDGLVGASLVEPGDAVEYGQELIVIELATAAAGGDA